MKVVLKFVIIMHGAQCVITVGMLWMPMWPADNLDTLDTVSYSVNIVPYSGKFSLGANFCDFCGQTCFREIKTAKKKK